LLYYGLKDANTALAVSTCKEWKEWFTMNRRIHISGGLCFFFFFAAVSSFASVIPALSGKPADLEAAIGKAKTGDIVQIPEGTFSFDATVKFPAGIYLRGAGKGKTILKRTKAIEGYLLQVDGGNGLSVYISDLRLEGVRDGKTEDGGITLENSSRDFRIFNCYLTKFGGRAVAVYGDSRGVIDHSEFFSIVGVDSSAPGYGVLVNGKGKEEEIWNAPLKLGTAYEKSKNMLGAYPVFV